MRQSILFCSSGRYGKLNSGAILIAKLVKFLFFCIVFRFSDETKILKNNSHLQIEKLLL